MNISLFIFLLSKEVLYYNYFVKRLMKPYNSGMNMRLRISPLCLLIVLLPLFGGCKKEAPNNEKIIYNDGTEEVVKEPTITSGLNNGEEVSILPKEWMLYYHDLEDEKNIIKYFFVDVENTAPQNLIIRWENKNPTSNYSFVLSDNKQMNEPHIYDVDEALIDLTDLYAGTHYYYQIKALYDDKTVISQRFDFKTVDFFRTIKIDGVLNARDLGNKKTKDGKKVVKQGLVYRTASFDSVSAKGIRQATETYGIKTDLDLREKGPTASPLGSGVQYINNGVGTYGSPYYVSYDTGVNVPEYQEAMRDNLKVFANKDNYPLAFHCAVGRDRTGTLAITLLLLLGVNKEQIMQDYLVSLFSKACNSEAVNFNNLYESMNTLLYYYENYKGGAESDNIDIYKRVENYCLHIGLSKDEITSIRNILLEDL